MKRIFAIILLTSLASCYRDPQKSETTINEIKVDFLFEKDGVRVYRFYDGGRARYFTTQGETFYYQGGKHEYEERIK